MAVDERQNGRAADGAQDRKTAVPGNDASAKPPDFESLAEQLAELREYIAYYLSTRADGVNARLRSMAVRALVVAEAGLVISAAVATAAVLLVVGLADGLTVLCGDRPWAGELAAGGVVLGAVWGATWLGKSTWRRSAQRNSTEKYARRRVKQSKRFGRDVRKRATADAPDGLSHPHSPAPFEDLTGRASSTAAGAADQAAKPD